MYLQYAHSYFNLLPTVCSFVEMARLLLASKEDGLFLLSERFSQDPLENYFGKQRARGGRNENPNLAQSLVNASAQSSAVLDPVRENCRRKRQLDFNEKSKIDDSPLPKRKHSNSFYLFNTCMHVICS